MVEDVTDVRTQPRRVEGARARERHLLAHGEQELHIDRRALPADAPGDRQHHRQGRLVVGAQHALAALASAAVGSVTAGAARILGAPGIALAGLLVVLLGLVSSGGPVGSQLLPDFYRALAPWMPAGELYSAMRNALFFDGAALAWPIEILAGWLVGGLVLMGAGSVGD